MLAMLAFYLFAFTLVRAEGATILFEISGSRFARPKMTKLENT